MAFVLIILDNLTPRREIAKVHISRAQHDILRTARNFKRSLQPGKSQPDIFIPWQYIDKLHMHAETKTHDYEIRVIEMPYSRRTRKFVGDPDSAILSKEEMAPSDE